MKHTMLINAVHKEQMRMATVNEKGSLIEFNIEMSVREPIIGNIFKSKVLKVERGLQAAFVDYGGDKDGFLPLKDVNHDYLTEQGNGHAEDRRGDQQKQAERDNGLPSPGDDSTDDVSYGFRQGFARHRQPL